MLLPSFLDPALYLEHPWLAKSYVTPATDSFSELRRLLGAENVLTEKEDLIPYSFDGTAALQQMPGCVVFAKTTEQVAGGA